MSFFILNQFSFGVTDFMPQHYKTDCQFGVALSSDCKCCLDLAQVPDMGWSPYISYFPPSFSENIVISILSIKTKRQFSLPQQPGKSSNNTVLPVFLLSIRYFIKNWITQPSNKIYSLAHNRSFVFGEVFAESRPQLSFFLSLQLVS